MRLDFIFSIIITIFSVVAHEVSHGYAARSMGDQTAERAGRLTLNPLKHLDLFGSIILPTLSYLLSGFMIGWAKPVPYNPYNLNDKRWGELKVALAGPATNIGIALFFGLLLRFLGAALPVTFAYMLQILVLINLVLATFNLVPIPPLDGSKIIFFTFPGSFMEFPSRH